MLTFKIEVAFVSNPLAKTPRPWHCAKVRATWWCKTASHWQSHLSSKWVASWGEMSSSPSAVSQGFFQTSCLGIQVTAGDQQSDITKIKCPAKTTKVTHWWSQKSQKQPKKKNTCSLCFPNMFFFSKNHDFWFTNWSDASPQTPQTVHIQGLTPGDSEVNIMARLITSKTGNFSLGKRRALYGFVWK